VKLCGGKVWLQTIHNTMHFGVVFWVNQFEHIPSDQCSSTNAEKTAVKPFGCHPFIQGGAPKIAKLDYNSN
jgi:hypothetical protein